MILDYDMEGYLEELSSKKPVPGGGGASALAGALGTALGQMVISLTVGKKKYEDVEETLQRADRDLKSFREMFLRLSDKDEEVFLPLQKAYGLPKTTDEEKKIRDAVLENVLYDAVLVPLSVMDAACGALETLETVAACGSRLAVSDAGVASAYLRTALTGARMNVLINLRSMKNEEKKANLSGRCARALALGLKLCDSVDRMVSERIG